MSISKMRLNLSETLNHGNLIDIKEEKIDMEIISAVS